METPWQNPLSWSLPNGVSLRKSVRDLFGLVDRETIQSGWIEITTDIPGIVGSAEIQAFDGEALTAIPLQPVQNSKFVFSHVARGYGFSTGLAIVNSGSEPVTLVLELRNPDSELLGTVRATNSGPGESAGRFDFPAFSGVRRALGRNGEGSIRCTCYRGRTLLWR